MPKINDTEAYPTKSELSLNDRFIGSDSKDNETTKNFSMEGVRDLMQDNLTFGEAETSGIPYEYSTATSPLFINEGQFGFVTISSEEYLLIHKTDLNGVDNSTLLGDINDNKGSVVISMSKDNDEYFYYTLNELASLPIDSSQSYSVSVLGTLSAGSFVGGEIYNFAYQIDTGGGTDLGYDEDSRVLSSSSGNDVTLPYATSTGAGLLQRSVRQTFTPTLYDALEGATYTFTSDGSYYERIGNMVFFQVRLISINTTGTPTGTLRVGGLPFSVTSTIPVPFTVGTFYGGDSNFYSIYATSKGGSTSTDFNTKDITFFIQDSLSGGTGVSNIKTISSCTITNGTINVSGFYPITINTEDYVN